MLPPDFERFPLVFEKHPHPMWIYDIKTLAFLAVNERAVERYGYTREEFAQKTLHDIIPQEEMARLMGFLAGEGARDPLHLGRWRHRRKDGAPIEVEVSATPVDFDGRPARHVLAIDITERLVAQRALQQQTARTINLMSRMPAILWTADASLNVTSMHGGALARLGEIGTKLVGQPIGTFTMPAGVSSQAHRRALLGEANQYTIEVNGRVFDCAVEPIYDASGALDCLVGIGFDITDRRYAERESLRSQRELSEAQRLARLGSWSGDLRTGAVHWSDELFRIMGVSPADAAAPLNLYAYDHPEDAEFVMREISAAKKDRTPYTLEHRIITGRGELRFVRAQGDWHYDAAGEPIFALGTVHDITERRAVEERLEYLAHHDPLTGLPNRALLEDRLGQSLARAQRHGRFCAVLFLDVDRFKNINDTFGHDVGDRLLVRVARRLQRALRPGDTVARPGGDEFVIVLDDVADRDDILELAAKVQLTFVSPFLLNGDDQFITASIGISIFPDDGATPQELLRSADSAMYVAKRSGGNAFRFYTASLHAAAVKALALENAMRSALERHEFRLAYQPIVRTSDGRVVGVEALSRWTHHEFGPIAPVDFITLAEEIGLIGELSERVLEQACKQAVEWIASGAIEKMSVNISAREVEDEHFTDRVKRALSGAKLDPQRLELEITETALVRSSPGTLEALVNLRRLGISLSIDDFGTGYSSLAYLKRLPVDTIKIDRSFITDLASDVADQSIARAIITVAHDLGKRVTAEGVEFAAQRDVLARLGCDELQGYYFGRPVSAEELEARWASRV